MMSSRSGFENGLLANSERRSERQLPTWTTWKTTIIVSAIVRASSSEVPHSGHITHPQLLNDDLAKGRLTLNFFSNVHAS